MIDESIFKTADYIVRREKPVLTRHDCPYRSALTFNAGVIKDSDHYIMMFRNDYGDYDAHTLEGTDIGIAFSDDGLEWKVAEKPCFELSDGEIIRAYDPRVTFIDGQYVVCFAADTRHGIRGGIAVTSDFENFDIKSLSLPDNRNMVLFPEKINGRYVRLERPMPVYSRGGDRFDIWLSESDDLEFWGRSRLVLATEDVPYCNDKIGPGAPPLKTDAGWLIIFHSVDRDDSRGKNGWEKKWQKRYCIGAALLDIHDPSKVIGLTRGPLMVPETYDETEEGFRTNTLFPCGALLDDGGKTLRIYYGASDTVVKVAFAPLDKVIEACTLRRKSDFQPL